MYCILDDSILCETVENSEDFQRAIDDLDPCHPLHTDPFVFSKNDQFRSVLLAASKAAMWSIQDE